MIENTLPDGVIQKLIDFKVVQDNSLIWSHDFVVSVRTYLFKPPSILEKTRIGNRAADLVQPILLAHAHDLAKEKRQFKANLERLVVSSCYLEYHFNRMGLKPDSIDVPNLIWGVFIVDRLNPEAV